VPEAATDVPAMQGLLVVERYTIDLVVMLMCRLSMPS
jgi:hypothetical protein